MKIKNNNEILNSFFNVLNHKDKNFNNRQSALKSWVNYVGEALAKNSIVQDLEGERLIVNVYNSPTLQILRLKESEILNKINKKYPTLKLRKLILKQVDKVDEDKYKFSLFKPQTKGIVEVKTNDIELDSLLQEIDNYSK